MKTLHKKPKGHFQRLTRTACAMFAGFLLFYGFRGLYADDIFIPNPRGRGALDFHGISAWMMAGAIFCFAAFLISCLKRSFEHPPNRPGYRIFNKWMRYIGTALFIVAFVVTILSIYKK
jgi:hypothetical protein